MNSQTDFLEQRPGQNTPWALAGLVLIGLMALAGSFSRGGVNTAFFFLWLFGLTYLIRFRSLKALDLPRGYLVGLAVFTAGYVAAIFPSPDPRFGIRALATLLYLLGAFPLAWLVGRLSPGVRTLSLWLSGASLLITAVIVTCQAWPSLDCVRAKSHVGIIELGAILGTLIPVMAARSFWGLSTGRIRQGFFFMAVTVAAFWALTLNCSRITMLTAPLLTLVAFAAFFKHLSRPFKLMFLGFLVVLAALLFSQPNTVARFKSITDNEHVASNYLRLGMWHYGWEEFKEHPVLGVGLANLPAYKHPDYTPSNYVEQQYGHVHNIFLTAMAEGGLVGLLALLALHVPPLWVAARRLGDSDAERRFWAWAIILMGAHFFLNGLTDQIFSLKVFMYAYWALTAFGWQVLLPSKTA